MEITGIVFTVYLGILIFIGFATFHFNKTQEDFLLAGRKLGPWVVAFSERASGESAWLLIALPGAAIAVGLGEIWAVIGIICGIISSWFIIAKRLRSETEKYDALTIPQYLHRKYHDKSNIIRLFSAFIIAFFFAFYVSAQFHASGKILNSIFGFDELVGIAIGAIIIILYTLMGGFFAVAWTDVFQGMLIVIILIVLPIVGIIKLGGLGSIFSTIGQIDYNSISPTYGYSGILFLLFAFASMAWFFGYPSGSWYHRTQRDG